MQDRVRPSADGPLKIDQISNAEQGRTLPKQFTRTVSDVNQEKNQPDQRLTKTSKDHASNTVSAADAKASKTSVES